MEHVRVCPAVAQVYLRRLAVVALITSSFMMACDSGTDPNAPQRINLQITPTFTSGAGGLAINRVRVIALASVTNEELGDTLFTVASPTGPWSVPIDVAKANAGPIIFQIELLNADATGNVVAQWAGVSVPITLTSGQRDVQQGINFVRGPLANLAVTNVTITTTPTTLPEGDSLRLVANANAPGSRVFFRSVNVDIATVDDNGMIRGVRPGPARIIAFAGNSADTADLTIVQRIASVLIAPSTPVSLGGIGAEFTLTARVLDPRGQDVPGQTVEWIIGNTNILSMPAAGRFRSIGAGTTQVTARAVGDTRVSSAVPVTVTQTPTTVSITPATPRLESIGARLTLAASVTDAAGTVIPGSSIVWASDNPIVASINATTGEVTANSNGTVVIRALSGAAVGQVSLTVQQRVNTLNLLPTQVTFNAVGATAQIVITATDPGGAAIANPTLTWSTSNAAVATASPTGLITSTGNGTATITASAPSGVQRTVQVTVQQQVVSLSVNPNFVLLESIGATATPTIDARDPRGSPVPASGLTINSTTPTVAAVSANGVITAVANGTAQIVYTAGALSAIVNVNVVQKAVSLKITPDTLRFGGLGQILPVTATLRDALGVEVPTLQFPNWQVDDPNVAFIGPNNTVVSQSNGTTILRATIGTLTGTAVVIVNQQATTVRITPNPLILHTPGTSAGVVGQVVDAAGNVLPPPGPITYSSANPSIASVNPTTGVVTGVNVGTTTITATSGSISGTATVHVNNTVARLELLPAQVNFSSLQDSLQLTVRAYDAANRLVPAPIIAWGVTDQDVVSVSPTGLIRSLANGTVVVTVIAGNATAQSTVQVKQIPARFEILTPPSTILIGETLQIEIDAVDANDQPIAASQISYKSSDDAIAEVGDRDGLVQAISRGTVTISVTIAGIVKTVTLTVE